MDSGGQRSSWHRQDGWPDKNPINQDFAGIATMGLTPAATAATSNSAPSQSANGLAKQKKSGNVLPTGN